MTTEPKYEIWGGNLKSLSFYDGGPASFLEDCFTLESARQARDEWQQQDHAAWIVDKNTRAVII